MTKPAAAELPPRARRIPLPPIGGERHPGTTSACAENTIAGLKLDFCQGNYLRVRGEYFLSEAIKEGREELPPRARRIHKDQHTTTKMQGTTSACAENTPDRQNYRRYGRNYLRVRGEYCATCS